MHCARRPEHLRFSLPAFVVLAFGLLLLGSGCGERGNPASKPGVTPENKEDALAAALRRLEKENDPNACRDVLQVIDSGMTLSEPRSEPTREELQKIGDFARLTRQEAAAVGAVAFAPADADYLSECLFLRDVVRSLEVDDYPPEVKAKLAFAWVCRMVYVIDQIHPQPAWLEDRAPPPWVIPAPAWWVLQDGSGTALDRAVIFLGVLRQLGLDGCLIGPPQLWDAPAFKRPTGTSPQPTYAPIRAVGVRVGKDIYLFDPRGGKPIAGSDPKKPATFAAVRAAPETTGEWLKASGVKADEVKTWEVFLSAPLSSLAPRMAWLQRQMAATNPVNLWTDVLSLRDRFEKEALGTEALKGVNCRFWSAAEDALSPARQLASYQRETATFDGKMVSPLKHEFLRTRFPTIFVPPPNIGGFVLEGSAFDCIRVVFDREYSPIFLTSGSPRDRLLRGQYSSALASLEEVDRVNSAHRTRIAREGNLAAALKEWSEKASPIFAAIIRAERSGDPGVLAKAKADEMEFLNSPASERVVSLVRRNTSLLLCAEAKYLIALVIHERAERIQARLEHAATPELRKEAVRAWDNAADNWRIFINNFPELNEFYKARFDHARHLQARAQQLVANEPRTK